MKHPPYELDAARRSVVLEVIRQVCIHRTWKLRAAHVRSTHVHLVVTAEAAPEKILADLKAYASRALNRSELDGTVRKRWTHHGSTRYLWKPDQVGSAIHYVVREQGMPMAVWEESEPGASATGGCGFGAKRPETNPRSLTVAALKSPGKVYLVGAGPGDPGLLTLKGQRILRAADVVVLDYLANPELLLEAKLGAEIVYVGRHAAERMSQDDINQLIVARAREGKMVCRLKGGDPFIFGRGGEEAEYVAASGVPFEIVPGVSAGYAVPAYAGIPLTHRQLSSTVLFITGHEAGHEDPEKEGGSDLDWEKIAHGASTLVFFMSVSTLPHVARKLIEAGRSPSTPVATIRWGTRGEQQVVVGTLETIAERVRAAGIKPPALTVVGDVVTLRERLQWFECLPLFGERILITRAREQAAELAEPLRALGAETIELPTIAIEDPADWSALDGAIRQLKTFASPGQSREKSGGRGKYDWIIFTSANGVRKFMERLAAARTDIRVLAGVKICAIGPATAGELGKHLLAVDVVPRSYVAEGVLEALAGEPVAGKRFLIPRAKVARDVLPEELRKRGAEVDVVEAYRTILPSEKNERSDAAERIESIFSRHRPTLIVFTSSSTVSNLLRLIPPEKRAAYLDGVRIASIGPITSQTIRRAGLPVHIEAREHTIPVLVEEIVEANAKAKAGPSSLRSSG